MEEFLNTSIFDVSKLLLRSACEGNLNLCTYLLLEMNFYLIDFKNCKYEAFGNRETFKLRKYSPFEMISEHAPTN